MAYMIITHLSGSKSNQKEKFSIDGLQKITLGRDTDSNIAYDPDMDDLVSRQHAQIEPDPTNPHQFILMDLNSRNGVFVNKARIHGKSPIIHGDIVQLGKNGPEFKFEIDPPPPETAKKTRLAEIPPEFLAKTREANFPDPVSFDKSGTIGKDNLITVDPGPKSSIGRETVERLIVSNKKESKKILINSMAAVLGIVALVAAVFFYKNTQDRHQAEQQMSQIQTQVEQTGSKVQSMQEIKTPRQIADMYSAATVFIEVSWKLIDTVSGKQLYHRHVKNQPAYIQLPNGTVEPWIVNDDENNTNTAIGGIHTGSGFVVAENGFIITNRHVAASWLTRMAMPLPGVLFGLNSDGNPEPLGEIKNYMGNLHQWVPARSLLLGGRTVGPKRIEGRLDTLDITFPKNKLRIPAKLVRISNEHDVALIKIETPEAIKKVEIDDTYDAVRPGDPITIMGYPGVSPNVFVATKSQDPFNPLQDIVSVPDPTVTPGIIGKVIRGIAQPVGGEVGDYYSESDSFQLTATATGGGNSGGPVFNEFGRVIGIFYSSRQQDLSDARITFAVPIKFAMDLMRVSPVLN